MSRDLNTEYKKHIENEIPDLWNRIEEALPSKNIDVTENNVVSIDSENGKKTKKINFNKMVIYAGAIAACACVALSIPVLMMSNNAAKSETASVASDESYDYAETAMEEAPAAAEYYDAEASESEAAYEDMEASESEAAYEAMEESESAEYYDAEASESEAAYEAEDDDLSAAINRDGAVVSNEDKAAYASATDIAGGETNIISDVQAEVVDFYKDSNKHMVKVKIINDPNKELATGDEIDVDITDFVVEDGAGIQIPFKKNEKITVNLACTVGESSSKKDYKLVDYSAP